MRSVKFLGLMTCLLAFCAFLTAADNQMGVRDLNRVTFSAPVRIGTSVLPAGDYTVRHTMQGSDHIMVFQRVHATEVVQVKCNLVPLQKKAERDEQIYSVSAGTERTLQELIFRGDSAKHVF